MIRRPPRSTLFPTRRSSDLRRCQDPSRLSALEFRLAPGLIAPGVALRRGARLGTRLAPGRRGGRRLRARLRPRRVVPRLVRAVRPLGPVAAVLSVRRVLITGVGGPSPPVRPVRMIRMIRVVRVVRMIGVIWTVPVIWTVRMIWTVGPPATALVVAPAALVAVGRSLLAPSDARRWDDPGSAEIPPPDSHVTAPVAGRRPLPHAGDEGLRALAILEDEARLGPQRPREHDPRAAVVAIGVVVRIVEDDDPEAGAGVIVGNPERISHIAVAVVAQKPRVVVALLDIVGDEVVVPIVVAIRYDAPGQIGEGEVRIAADATVGDHAIVPMVAA